MIEQITYTKGDATQPSGVGNKIVVHICNDIGKWGKGFVMAVSKRWPAPEQQYREWYKSKKGFDLGQVQLVQVEPDTWVANMIGQHRITKDEKGNQPIRYDAVTACLEKVAEKPNRDGKSSSGRICSEVLLSAVQTRYGVPISRMFR